MTDERIEIITESVMKAIAENLIESRNKYAEAVLDDTKETPPFSLPKETFDKLTILESQNTEAKAGSHNYYINRVRHIIKKTATIAAVLVLTMGLFLSVSEAARKYLYNAFFDKQSEHYVVMFGPDDQEAPIYRAFIVTYIPAGYDLTYRETDYVAEHGGATLYEEYTRDHNILRVEIVPRELTQITVDSANMDHREVEFDGIVGQFFYSDSYSILLWSDGRYEYEVSGNLNLDDYIDVSRGIEGLE